VKRSRDQIDGLGAELPRRGIEDLALGKTAQLTYDVQYHVRPPAPADVTVEGQDVNERTFERGCAEVAPACSTSHRMAMPASTSSRPYRLRQRPVLRLWGAWIQYLQLRFKTGEPWVILGAMSRPLRGFLLSFLALTCSLAGCDFPPPADVPGDGSASGPGSGSDAGLGSDSGSQTGTGHVQVTVEAGSGGGAVTAAPGIQCGAQCTADVPIGTTLSLTASAPAGSIFIGWRGAAIGCGRALSCTVPVAADVQIGARFAQQGTAAWALPFAGAGGEGVNSVAVDPSGNAVAVVSFSQNVSFGGTNFVSTGNAFALIKLTPAGDVVWSKPFNPPSETYPLGLAIDGRNGDVVLWGAYSAGLDLGGPSLLALPPGDTKDFFVARYGADSSFRWQHAIHASDNDDPGMATSVAIDAVGDIVIAGAFNTSIDLGSGPLTTTNGEGEAFAGKLSGSDGAVIWSKKLGGITSGLFINVIAINSFNQIYFGGSFSGICNVGGPNLTATSTDGIVFKLDGAGNFSSQLQITTNNNSNPGGGEERVVDITTDASNNVYFATNSYHGSTPQSILLGGLTLAGAGLKSEIVLAKLDSFGAVQWANRYGTAADDSPKALRLLGDGNLAVIGTYGADIAFGTKSLVNAGNADGFLLRINPGTGSPTFAARIAGVMNDQPTAFATSGGTAILGGSFQAHTDVIGIGLDGVGGPSDAYIASIALPAP